MVCEFCVLFAQESRMNKLLTTITLLCFSIGATAQEREIWACQQEAGTQLVWEGGRWKSIGVTPTPLLLTIDGANSSYKQGDSETKLVCSEEREIFALNLRVVRCSDILESDQILFDKNTGRMGISYLFGALMEEEMRIDSVAARIYNCTKF